MRNPFLTNNNTSISSLSSSSSSSSSTTISLPRELSHIWELGGLYSSTLNDLIAVPFTPQRLPTGTFILVLDLSKPGDMCTIAIKYISLIKKRIDECIEKLKVRSTATTTNNTPKETTNKASNSNDANVTPADYLYQQTQARIRLGYAQRNDQRINVLINNTNDTTNTNTNENNNNLSTLPYNSPAFIQQILSSLPDHPDWKLLTTNNNNSSSINTNIPGGTNTVLSKYNHLQNILLPLQTIVVGHRWDALKDIEAPKRRIVLATLRFIGLSLGAHVVCTSIRDTATLQNFRHFLYHSLFLSEVSRVPIGDNDGNRPLMIPAGTDTFDSILSIFTNSGSSNNNKLPNIKKSDFETTLLTFPQRLDKFNQFVQQYFPGSSINDPNDNTDGGNTSNTNDVALSSTIAFTDEAATVYPETIIDILRTNKAEELQKYMRDQKEKERKLVLEQKAAAAASSSKK